MTTDTRLKVFKIRVSDREYAYLRAAAGEGREVSTWARRVLLDPNRGDQKTSPRFSTHDARELVRALNAIGSNINQIARAMNADDCLPPAEVIAAHAEVVAMIKKISEDID